MVEYTYFYILHLNPSNLVYFRSPVCLHRYQLYEYGESILIESLWFFGRVRSKGCKNTMITRIQNCLKIWILDQNNNKLCLNSWRFSNFGIQSKHAIERNKTNGVAWISTFCWCVYSVFRPTLTPARLPSMYMYVCLNTSWMTDWNTYNFANQLIITNRNLAIQIHFCFCSSCDNSRCEHHHSNSISTGNFYLEMDICKEKKDFSPFAYCSISLQFIGFKMCPIHKRQSNQYQSYADTICTHTNWREKRKTGLKCTSGSVRCKRYAQTMRVWISYAPLWPPLIGKGIWQSIRQTRYT